MSCGHSLLLIGACVASSCVLTSDVRVQTYSGGRDIWGLHDDSDKPQRPEEVRKHFKKPIFDDGEIEVVGLRSGWHTWAVLSQLSRRVHGERLGQGSEVVVDFHRPKSGQPRRWCERRCNHASASAVCLLANLKHCPDPAPSLPACGDKSIDAGDFGCAGGTAAFMRLDGEPWMQDLDGTSEEQPLQVPAAAAIPSAAAGR